ncbi:MAG: N-acetylmuramate alpha-1-phosphate uridylyltransferase MurU [Pseudomonadota bacterium]
MKAMLLAAGRGERLRPLTDTTPKALVEVRGKPLIDYHLEALGRAGCEQVVINLGWLGNKILDHVGDGGRFGVRVVFSPEGENILETGGGILRALPMLGSDPFVVMNGDVFTDMPVPSTDLADGSLAKLILVPTPDYKQRGDFDLKGDRVVSSDEPLLTFSGVAVYEPEFFNGCEPGRFPLAPMFYQLADEGRLQGERYDGVWEDVGTKERLDALNGG